MSSASASCLQNLIIIQKILKHLSPFSMENLKLRLINKSFNSAVIHHIRTTHRSIRMEVPGAQDFRLFGEPQKTRIIKLILVNDHCVGTERIFDYLEFLRTVAKVKVEHLVMINCWATVSCDEWRKDLHDKIHKLLNKERLQTFIGMCDLCSRTCDDCYHAARNSSYYGPYQVGIAISFDKYREEVHYKKLIIDEQGLQWFANVSNDYANGSFERLLEMKEALSPFVSCDQLCFKIGEFHWKSKQRLDTQPIPLEAIEWMCDIWKADSIVIEYDYFPQTAIKREIWSRKRIFTPVRFDELYEEDVDNHYLGAMEKKKKKDRKFSSVTVDMRNTEKIYREVIDGSIDQNQSYSNLIANVRRVFPTDKIIIIGQKFLSDLIFNQECFENILKSVWKNKGRLEVTIQHELPISLIDNNFEIPESIDILGRRLKCTLLPERLTSRNGFIGRTYQITDNIGDKTLNLELFISRKPLNFLQNFYST